MFPRKGPLWKQTPISRALLSISFGIPNKGAVPPGSLYRARTEREAPFPEPSIRLPNEPTPGSPTGPL
jgi:hypothetical protein